MLVIVKFNEAFDTCGNDVVICSVWQNDLVTNNSYIVNYTLKQTASDHVIMPGTCNNNT